VIAWSSSRAAAALTAVDGELVWTGSARPAARSGDPLAALRR
jgi:hypothetical protein